MGDHYYFSGVQAKHTAVDLYMKRKDFIPYGKSQGGVFTRDISSISPAGDRRAAGTRAPRGKAVGTFAIGIDSVIEQEYISDAQSRR